MNKELFDLTVDIAGMAKLAGIHTKYGREKEAKRVMNKLYGKILLLYEEGLPRN